MSGHSKWHKIQHKKGKNDAQRGAMFTKLCSSITIAAKEGGGDPDMNFSLRLAIDKAKAGNVPKDNIERAVKRGTGELNDGVEIQELMYEGYGPGGVAMLIEVITDNSNRSVAEVKHMLSKHGGSLGGPGSVQWQFEHLGVILISSEEKKKVEDWDSLELALIEAGASDIISSDEGVEIRCPMASFQAALTAVQAADITPEESSLQWVAKDEVPVDDAISAQVEKLYEALEELDDVKEVYTNEK